jgi:hypothetical protein
MALPTRLPADYTEVHSSAVGLRTSPQCTEMTGIKELTPTNWREPDPVMSAFGRLDPDRGVMPMLAEDWASLIMEVDINPLAPEEIRILFAVGRGTMLYGWFYYPLYAIGEDQLHRVAECAVSHRFTELGGPAKARTFAARIRWLNQQGVIPDDEVHRWDAIREIRNIGSHPDFQRVGPPGQALSTLKIIAQSIDQVLGLGRVSSPSSHRKRRHPGARTRPWTFPNADNSVL